MNDKKRYTDKVAWTLVIFFVFGIFLLFGGVFLHPKERSALSQTFIDLGGGIIISSVIAHLVS